MPVVSIKNPKNAKTAGVDSFVRSEDRFGIFEKIISIIRATWPKKTAAHVSHLAGVSERAVQFWLAGETRMSIEHVVALLRTDNGYQILAAIMGDSQAEWWQTTKVAHGLRQSRRAIKAQQKRIEELRALQSQIDLFDQ